MTGGHPQDLPDLFLDRSLGRRQVPGLLREAGLRLRTLAEVYGLPEDEKVADVDWWAEAGAEGWIVLMKDERIRYRHAERSVILNHRVQAFALTGGNLKAAEMAEQILVALPAIVEACRQSGPFLYAVSSSGIRRIDLT